MKKYYISINGTQSELLTFEELKAKNITKDTMVWFEGLDDWKEANNIEELKDIFKSIPPPIKAQTPPVSVSSFSSPVMTDDDDEELSFFETHKTKIFIVAACLAFVIIFYSFSNNNQNSTNVPSASSVNETKEQLENQQIQIDLQNQKIAEQEKQEAIRNKELRKEKINNRIDVLIQEIAKSTEGLEQAKAYLNDVSGFKLLREGSERNQQINEATKNVEDWTNQLSSLKLEFENLNRELISLN